jgi:hypothetical protein
LLMILLVGLLNVFVNAQEQGAYYFAVLATPTSGRLQNERVSNIFYTTLGAEERATKIRERFVAYQGVIHTNGPHADRGDAAKALADFQGLATFSVPDPLK